MSMHIVAPHGINLRHLHAFVSVAATGGVRRAADSLFRASSAVTRSVLTLEQALGVTLFERKGRGMLLTVAGAKVHARALRIESELRQISSDAIKASQGIHDTSTIASAPEALFNERRLKVASLLGEVHHMPSVARTVGMSQSAVSQAIARLEHALGQSLFTRTAHGTVPTEAGIKWLPGFERALCELNHIGPDIAALSGVLEGTVTIGALPLARTLMLPAAINALQQRHPELRVHSLESPYETLCAGLLSGKIDFLVGALRPGGGGGLATVPLFEDHMILVAGARHPLARRSRITTKDLKLYPWVLSRSGTPLRELLDQFFLQRQHTPPVPAVETGDLALLRGLLSHGQMITVLSRHQLHVKLESGILVTLHSSCQEWAGR
jgi:LysR family transcriptional regulator of gallate degradation